MTSGYEEVLNHLLFHKALEEERGEKIERYLGLLERVQEGFDYASADYFERSLATAFHLVMDQSFDPWDIDLVRFSKAYIDRLRRVGTVNFTAAGRIVLMAWSVLRLQTQAILSSAEPVNPPVEDTWDSWDAAAGLYREPEDVDFTHQILTAQEPPLSEAFQRDASRPVTLLDLLDAFAKAFEEASGALKAPRPRRRPPIEALRGKIHREDLEEDIQRTWRLIRNLSKDVVRFSELCNGNRWDRATIFLSMLFLSMMGWVEIWQDDFPWGEVYLRPLREDQVVEVPVDLKEAQVA